MSEGDSAIIPFFYQSVFELIFGNKRVSSANIGIHENNEIIQISQKSEFTTGELS